MEKRNKLLIWLIIVILASTIAIYLLPNSPTEFFDIFGLLTFTFLFAMGIWMFKSKKRLSDWVPLTIMFIGILGLIVDGFIVIKTYFLG